MIFLACGGNNGTNPQNPSVSNFEVPLNHIYTDTLNVSVKISDPQGFSDLDSVWGSYGYLGSQTDRQPVRFNDEGIDGDSAANDGKYSAEIMPSAGEFQFGYYDLSVRAVDKSGNLSGQLEKSFWVVIGEGPILFDPVAPDSIQRGTLEPSFITIRSYDPDGLADIDSVYLITIRPDSTSSGAHFYMYDDGYTYDDQVAADGTYTIGIVADPGNQLGEYIFTFYALDTNGNQSNNPFKIITVY